MYPGMMADDAQKAERCGRRNGLPMKIRAGDFGGIIVFLVFEAERCCNLVDLVGQDGIVKLANNDTVTKKRCGLAEGQTGGYHEMAG
ncbi:hypothetical protein CCHR01_00007 [Colletotrichum chrysophilum]|uniref:Uncharacterized protein n=1 Tax=Colletotrichum chrysophilum TaxID=1836956 RepID=A0AAD9AZ79_9PEZI|nr:hypothetical protein CCHR01_00007 [Colletotrichum chrysophilum]